MNLKNIDTAIVHQADKLFVPFGRFALFVVYFWFGILKIMDTSAANPLVERLQQATLPFLSFELFIVLFSLFEMFIGILFLIPAFTRAAVLFLVFHMVTTFMPLLFLPEMTWQKMFTPTLEGQYIIKNLVIIAVVIGISARLKPLRN